MKNDDRLLQKKKKGDEEPEEFEEFEEIDEEDEDDEIDWEDSDEKEVKSKNPLGLKVSEKKPIPVRKPKSSGPGGIEKSDDPNRGDKIRKDRLESAKRYESLRLFEDAVKYYTMAGELDEAERVRGVMEGLYLKKAKEFESAGSMDEAAHLYDILKMKEDATRCRAHSSVPKMPNLSEEEPTSGAIAAFIPMNNPNLPVTDPETSPYIAAGQEEVSKDMPVRKPKEKDKAFVFCPYCGEDIDLPKPPKFCPYCREPFA